MYYNVNKTFQYKKIQGGKSHKSSLPYTHPDSTVFLWIPLLGPIKCDYSCSQHFQIDVKEWKQSRSSLNVRFVDGPIQIFDLLATTFYLNWFEGWFDERFDYKLQWRSIKILAAASFLKEWDRNNRFSRPFKGPCNILGTKISKISWQ